MFIKKSCKIKSIYNGVKYHHFFGYYNKSPWNASGNFLLSNRVEKMSEDLTGKEVSEVGYFDLSNNNAYISIDKTTTWNWQMGCQLQWLGGSNNKTDENLKIIYNVRTSQVKQKASSAYIYPDFCSIIYDVNTKTKTTLPLPIYVVAPNASYFLSVDYSRFQVTHRTIGYSSTVNEPNLENAPKNDGMYFMDLKTNQVKLILSLDDLKNFQNVSSMDKAIHWITHIEISPDSKRILFIHRWSERVEDETCYLHRLFTINKDGTDLSLLECTDHDLPQLRDNFDINSVGFFDYEKSQYQISHPAWKNNEEIIAWTPHEGKIAYHLYNYKTKKVREIAKNILCENGHMTYAPNSNWLLTDTYPDNDTNERLLLLYNEDSNKCYDIGSFYTSPNLGKENRCDLHPRWQQNGLKASIDSVHESIRQQYIVDVEEVIKG